MITYINSRNRESGTNSYFQYNFAKNNIVIPNDIDRVVVLQASIPKTYYLVDSTNEFTLIENEVSVNISILPGNYSEREFRRAVSAQLNQNSPNHWIYSIELDLLTYKFIYAVQGNSDVQPSISVNNRISEQLGFENGSINSFVNNSLVSTDIPNMNLEGTLFIKSDICQNESNDNVLQEIYTGGNLTNTYIIFENKCPKEYSKPFSHRGQQYNFWLTNEDGYPIDLNGINMNITLLLFRDE